MFTVFCCKIWQIPRAIYVNPRLTVETRMKIRGIQAMNPQVKYMLYIWSIDSLTHQSHQIAQKELYRKQ